jgi:hypothetical protein
MTHHVPSASWLTPRRSPWRARPRRHTRPSSSNPFRPRPAPPLPTGALPLLVPALLRRPNVPAHSRQAGVTPWSNRPPGMAVQPAGIHDGWERGRPARIGHAGGVELPPRSKSGSCGGTLLDLTPALPGFPSVSAARMSRRRVFSLWRNQFCEESAIIDGSCHACWLCRRQRRGPRKRYQRLTPSRGRPVLPPHRERPPRACRSADFSPRQPPAIELTMATMPE